MENFQTTRREILVDFLLNFHAKHPVIRVDSVLLEIGSVSMGPKIRLRLYLSLSFTCTWGGRRIHSSRRASLSYSFFSFLFFFPPPEKRSRQPIPLPRFNRDGGDSLSSLSSIYSRSATQDAVCCTTSDWIILFLTLKVMMEISKKKKRQIN